MHTNIADPERRNRATVEYLGEELLVHGKPGQVHLLTDGNRPRLVIGCHTITLEAINAILAQFCVPHVYPPNSLTDIAPQLTEHKIVVSFK